MNYVRITKSPLEKSGKAHKVIITENTLTKLQREYVKLNFWHKKFVVEKLLKLNSKYVVVEPKPHPTNDSLYSFAATCDDIIYLSVNKIMDYYTSAAGEIAEIDNNYIPAELTKVLLVAAAEDEERRQLHQKMSYRYLVTGYLYSEACRNSQKQLMEKINILPMKKPNEEDLYSLTTFNAA